MIRFAVPSRPFPFSITVAVISTLFLAACQSPPSDAGFTAVQKRISDGTGLAVQWNQHSTEDAATDQAVAGLLAHDLTVDRAVQIALLNNRHLQATFENLGVAQADLVQAGLLRNPVFDLGVRFPDRGPSATYLDMGVAFDFLDIAMLPARKKIAAEHFKQTQAAVCDQVLTLVARTSADFYACQAAGQLVDLRKTIRQATLAALTAATKLHDAGNLTDLDFANQRAEDIRAQIDLADAQAVDADAREQVNDRLGLTGPQVHWTAARPLPEIPANDGLAGADLESFAVLHREDLAIARDELYAQANTLGIADQYRFLDQATVGPEFERETDSQWRIGPSLTVPIPIFDQGQARLARAQALFLQAIQNYNAQLIDVRSDVRAAQARLSHARTTALLYRDQLLPVEQDRLDQTQLQYNGALVGVFQLLQVRREQIDATAHYVDARRDYWTARVDLERAIGSRLAAAATQPSHASTQPDDFQGEHP